MSSGGTQVPTPRCPSCGFWVMMGYSDPPGSSNLVWACKGCGSTFTYDREYRLTPYLTEIHYPACPRCGGGMVEVAPGNEAGTTRWRCPGCGEHIDF